MLMMFCEGKYFRCIAHQIQSYVFFWYLCFHMQMVMPLHCLYVNFNYTFYGSSVTYENEVRQKQLMNLLPV